MKFEILNFENMASFKTNYEIESKYKGVSEMDYCNNDIYFMKEYSP